MTLPRLILVVTVSLLMDSGTTAEQALDDDAIARAITQATVDHDAKALAWAARGAEGHASPLVVQALMHSLTVRAQMDEPSQRRCAIDEVLDQLIRDKASLPSGILEDLIDEIDHRDQAVILAALDPDISAPALRHLVDKGRGSAAWVAACNVLASARDRSLALPLLRQLVLHHILVVTSPDHVGSVASGRAVVGCGSVTVPAAFPPDPLYHLTLTSRAGDLFVAAGPRLVTATRTEYPAGKHGVGSTSTDVDADTLTTAYLILLQDSHSSVPRLTTPETVQIAWTDAVAFLAVASVARKTTEQRWNRTVDALVLAGMLSPTERLTVAPHMVVTVHDLRDSTTLDVVPAVPGMVPVDSASGAQRNSISH